MLYRERPGLRESRIYQVLEFFGIPYQTLSFSELGKAMGKFKDGIGGHAILCPIDIFGELLEDRDGSVSLLETAEAVYLYTTDDVPSCTKALRSLPVIRDGSLKSHFPDSVRLSVSSDFPDLTGPMTGIQVSTRLGEHDYVFVPGSGNLQFVPIISADNAPIFLMIRLKDTPCFIVTSSRMVDLDAPLTERYYDIKADFCSALPLTMFLRYVFAEVMWRPLEYGACFIIDDPLLKSRYGLCDFHNLATLMDNHEFKTNIAFIPWNWRRTSRNAAEFFRREKNHFSVSIHGCDHIAAEFGGTAIEDLKGKARLAQSRMRLHEARTGIHHDPIMVFPQGVFSIPCLEVLKRSQFVAAVNTEVTPVGNRDIPTQIRDVWDVAIMTYGSFPIFSRRYAYHGLENLAFDLLLGKPCLIVAHHDFFRNEGEALVELIEKLSSLNCTLQWRPLGEVLRRACRYRVTDTGTHEFWMYCQELLVNNGSIDNANVTIRKRVSDPIEISRVESPEGEMEWKVCQGYIEFSAQVPVGKERLFKVVNKEYPEKHKESRDMKYELYVAARRILSEIRDEGMFQMDRLKK